MALRQTRRGVSLSEHLYTATKHQAAINNQTMAHYVDLALLAYGVSAPAGMHQTPAVAKHARQRRVASGREVTRRVAQGMVSNGRR